MDKNIIIFSDIGDDIDDSLALSFLLWEKNVRILWLVVSHGHVLHRAQEAEHICQFFDKQIPIIIGSAWTIQHTIDRENDAISDHMQSIISSIDYFDVLCIGPCTDLAKCMMHIDWFSNKIRNTVIQGWVLSDYKADPASYNFMCDMEAANYCFSHCANMTFIDKYEAYKNPLSADDILSFTDNDTLNIYLHKKALERMQKFQMLNHQKWQILYGNNPHILSYPYDLLAAKKLTQL